MRQLLFWFIFVCAFVSVWHLLSLPDEATIKLWLQSWLHSYGLWFVFFGALLEALLLVGFYFPGSLLIFISVASASGFSEAMLMVLVVSLGVYLGYLTDYLLGKYGWYHLLLKMGMSKQLETAKQKVIKNDFKYAVSTYWNPAFASITATACGVVKIPFARFTLVSIPTVLLWNLFWGVLVYTLGDSALSIISTKTVLICLGFAMFYVALKSYLRRLSESKK